MGVGGKVRVLIATTVGPVEVLRLTEEDPAIGRSVVCIDGTTDIAGITADYQAFVASPTGIIERLYGHSCYRMDISKQIDAGSSWQLGVFAAHALHAADRLAREGEHCDTVLLATGAVHAIDLDVLEVTHASTKIELALDTLRRQGETGSKIVVALPAGNLPDVADHIRAQVDKVGAHLAPVENLDELMRKLSLRRPAPKHRQAGKSDWMSGDLKPGRVRRLVLAVLVGLFVAAAAVVASHRVGWITTMQPAVAAAGKFDGIWELKGEGQTCSPTAWTTKVSIVEGWIPSSHPDKGFVAPAGEFRFTRLVGINARTLEYSGRLSDGIGDGQVRTIGGACLGTITMRRLER